MERLKASADCWLNMGFVHRGGKAIWISEASESFAPGPLMGG
jgi:hypothetical protein